MQGIAGRLAGEVGKFMTVGLVATSVAFVLFNGMVHGVPGWDAPLNGQPQLAYFIANCVGMVISFRGTRDWAFRERDVRHPDGGRTAYVVINLITMLIPMGCLWFTRSVLHLDDPVSDNLSANFFGLLAGTATRFALFRQYVFPRNGLGAAALAEAEADGAGAMAEVEADGAGAVAEAEAVVAHAETTHAETADDARA